MSCGKMNVTHVRVIVTDTNCSYRPLERSQPSDSIELCSCCTCYPFEEEDETTVAYPDGGQWQDHPYLAPQPDNNIGRAV